MNGVNGEFIFKSTEDRIAYQLMLAATVVRFGWRCLSYCQMGTHVHLLVETPEPNFGAGMQWLHGHYGRCFNKQHGRKGHLFQGRYHDEPILSGAHLLNVVGYIAMNPVEGGLCSDPRLWEWGSHQGVTRGVPKPWLSHQRLVERLDGMMGPGAYERLIAERELARAA